MSQCSVCKKLLKENIREFFNYEGRSDYKVIEKVGKLSYRCSCHRCGHMWLTRSDDAKFQFENPIKYEEHRLHLERCISRMNDKYGYKIFTKKLD